MCTVAIHNRPGGRELDVLISMRCAAFRLRRGADMMMWCVLVRYERQTTYSSAP